MTPYLYRISLLLSSVIRALIFGSNLATESYHSSCSLKYSQSHSRPSYMHKNKIMCLAIPKTNTTSCRKTNLTYPKIAIRVPAEPPISKLRRDYTSTGFDSTLTAEWWQRVTWPFLPSSIEVFNFFGRRPLRYGAIDILLKIAYPSSVLQETY